MKHPNIDLSKAQVEDAGRLSKSYGHILANPVGSGKTRTILSAFSRLENPKGLIVVGPKRIIRDVWPAELSNFPDIQNLDYVFLYTFEEIINRIDFVLDMMEHTMVGTKWTLVIDEVHLVKNPKTLRSKAIMKLRKKCHFVWGMTGTPCDTRPMDLYGISEVIGRPISQSKNAFTKEYCESKEVPIYSGYSRYPKYYMKVPTAFTKEGYEKLQEWFGLNLTRRPP